MILNRRSQKTLLNLRDIIELQLHVHFLLQKKVISRALCTCLAIIAERDSMLLLDICNEACDDEIYGNPMSARCALNKAVNTGILIKESKGHRKTVRLSEEINLVTSGNMLLNYEFGRIEK